MTNDLPTTRCPKCGYQRRPEDTAPAWQCPSCQVAYAKVIARSEPVADANTNADTDAGALADQQATEAAAYAESSALGQRMVIGSIALGAVMRAIDNAKALPALATLALWALLALLMLRGILKLCSGLRLGQGHKLLCLVLAFFPLANLVMLAWLNSRAVKQLRAAGWRIGLLGARP
jgi:hypothetical protein